MIIHLWDWIFDACADQIIYLASAGVNGFGGAVGVVARAKIKCKDYDNR